MIIALGRATLVLAVAALAGCSITHRSEGFACAKQADCSGGRMCLNGFCVTGVEPDAASTIDTPGHDGNQCPSQCTTCDLTKNSCTIDCSGSGECNSGLACPDGFTCDVTCGSNSCRGGIDCTAGKGCTIKCQGTSSCRNIDCGTSACNVACNGQGSCRAIDCSQSCACDVTCIGQQSCADGGPTCPPTAGCSLGAFGCTSQSPGCDTCP